MATKQPTAPTEKQKAPKKLPSGVMRIHVAGDLVMVKCSDPKLAGRTKRFQDLFETFANMEKQERFLNYKFIVALILTSHAKKHSVKAEKKKLFDLKNDLFLSLANNIEVRKKVGFAYIKGPRPLITDSCTECKATNAKTPDLPIHKLKFCSKCKVDRDFFDLLSMHHKFPGGSATLFLSRDKMHLLRDLPKPKPAKRSDFDEEAKYLKYGYNVRNLDAFHLEDTLKLYKKLSGNAE